MLGKFLLTVAVIVLAFYAVRQRFVGNDPARHAEQTRGTKSRHRMIQLAAALVVVVMVAGSLWSLLGGGGGGRGQEIVMVEVVNPGTGIADRFEARRADVGERVFTTTDGRRIQVSEVERIVVIKNR